MSYKISPKEVIEHIAFGALDTNEQAVVYSAAACDQLGVPYSERMTSLETQKLSAVQDKFFPIRKPGRMFPRFANDGQPTSCEKHEWGIRPEFQPRVEYPACPRCGQESGDADFAVPYVGLRCMADSCAFESPGFLSGAEAIAWWQRQQEANETGSWTCGNCHGVHDADVRICPTHALDETDDEFICSACARGDHDEVPVHSAECDKCELCVGCCPHPDDNRDSRCGNCETIWSRDDLNEAKDLSQRLTPGDVVPSGECPDCGALCYLLSEIDEDAFTSDQVYESLEAAIDAVCNEDMQRDISREYKKQIRMRYEADKASEGPSHPQIAEPIRDGEESHLFIVAEIYELKTWANGYLQAVAAYVEVKNFVEDDWVEYKLPSGEIADVQFSQNEDEQSPRYKGIEAFAYRTKSDGKGSQTTDTDDCVRLF